MDYKVFLMIIINSFIAMGYSIISPLFPVIGRKIGLSENVLGWIISSYALANFSITPFAPYLVSKFGRRTLFYIACLIEATSILLYGLLYFVNNYTLFLVLTFTVRLIHGIGGGIITTSLFSIVASLSNPDTIVNNLGYLEVAWTSGVSLGPLTGSVLYHVGGFTLPFITFGIVFYIVIFLSYRNVNISNEISEESVNIFQYMNVEMLSNYACLLIYQIANTYYFPSLTYHLTRKWNLSVEISSLFFMIAMGTYFVLLSVLNKIIKNLGLIVTLLLGQIVIFFGAPFVYPLEFLPQSLFSIIFGLILLGSSAAFTCVPVIIQYQNVAKKINKSINAETANDISSAFFNLGIYVGDFLGPVYGGFISHEFGFKYSNICTSILGLLMALYFYLYYREYINSVIKDIFVNGISKARYNGEEEKQLERGDIKFSLRRKPTMLLNNFRKFKSAVINLGDEKETLLLKTIQSSQV